MEEKDEDEFVKHEGRIGERILLSLTVAFHILISVNEKTLPSVGREGTAGMFLPGR